MVVISYKCTDQNFTGKPKVTFYPVSSGHTFISLSNMTCEYLFKYNLEHTSNKLLQIFVAFLYSKLLSEPSPVMLGKKGPVSCMRSTREPTSLVKVGMSQSRSCEPWRAVPNTQL